ncbi:hypothetical protein M9H77_18238 [Catharanthus roseus]|uniref:Uncharacterized protein n=1 Tax=Catharanthus roseus TaxID=4058 RepID=A0ACC0B6X7_CATRO|nr:hypothetical protein M9H77_18238 [Catharanthus roseus]
MSEKSENAKYFSFLSMYPSEIETMKRKQKRSENDEIGSRRQKDRTYRGWQGNLPSIVGAEDGWERATRDLPWTVGLTLPSVVDYSQGCLELKKEEQSRATNWGLIGSID